MSESFSKLVLDPTLLNLHHAVFPEINQPNGVFGDQAEWYGLIRSGEIVAFCTVGLINQDRIIVYNVGVPIMYRHQGNGHQLMNHLIQLFKHKEIYLFVKKNNLDVINFYKKHGFKNSRVYVPPEGEMGMRRI